jgi:hypothetical protein
MDVTGADLEGLDDDALTQLAALIRDEQQRRALERSDIDAVVAHAFGEGFRADGMPRDPWITGGLLVCPGTRADRSATSHECSFVTIGERWVWECEEKIHDEVRHLPGPRTTMRSITVCAVWEGMELDAIQSRMRSGVHQARQVRSFVVRNGALELVSARARGADYGRERR